VGEVARSDDGALLCLRPGEWLVVDATSGSVPGANWCLDRSHALATLRVTGAAAPWLLAQLCALDFDAMAHDPGEHCAQARVGVSRVVLHRHCPGEQEAPCWDLLVDRSLTRDLWERLAAAAPQAVALAARFRAGETRG
jgi:heterotetrameric sarcosine oxidase gamma subunit